MLKLPLNSVSHNRRCTKLLTVSIFTSAVELYCWMFSPLYSWLQVLLSVTCQQLRWRKQPTLRYVSSSTSTGESPGCTRPSERELGPQAWSRLGRWQEVPLVFVERRWELLALVSERDGEGWLDFCCQKCKACIWLKIAVHIVKSCLDNDCVKLIQSVSLSAGSWWSVMQMSRGTCVWFLLF